MIIAYFCNLGAILRCDVYIFGKSLIKANKPKNKYSEEELENVLIEEVKKKIENNKIGYDGVFHPINTEDYSISPFIGGEKCPRCGTYEFSTESLLNSDTFSGLATRYRLSDLYKCKKCHLELTMKEYEIAKKIKLHAQTGL